MAAKILQLGTGEFWALFAVLVLLALAGLYGTFRFFTRARLIEDTPTSKIRSAAQGYIELSGIADLLEGTPIVAPLSQLQCVWYRYKIEEQRKRYRKGRTESYWATLESGTSDGLFRLADDTGECVVDPEGAEVTPSIRQTWYGGSHYPGRAPPIGRGDGGGFFSRLGISASFGFGHYRYTEERILPATELYAIGQFRTLGSDQAGDRQQEIGDLLRSWKRDQAEMLQRFDANGDGEIDLQEWDAARRAAEQAVDGALRERQVQPALNVLARTGISRRPFMLSTRPQGEIARDYRIYAAACVAAFLGGGAAAVWSLGVRLAGAG
ncbi:MAG TPA: GIDE domain-containing protein [Gammaproteobacteria bacterium]